MMKRVVGHRAETSGSAAAAAVNLFTGSYRCWRSIYSWPPDGSMGSDKTRAARAPLAMCESQQTKPPAKGAAGVGKTW